MASFTCSGRSGQAATSWVRHGSAQVWATRWATWFSPSPKVVDCSGGWKKRGPVPGTGPSELVGTLSSLPVLLTAGRGQQCSLHRHLDQFEFVLVHRQR